MLQIGNYTFIGEFKGRMFDINHSLDCINLLIQCTCNHVPRIATDSQCFSFNSAAGNVSRSLLKNQITIRQLL